MQRKKLLSQDTRKKRGRRVYDIEDADLDQAQAHDAPVVVADHAWRVLQWLLSLFEKDELLNFHKSGGKDQLLDKLRNDHYFVAEKFSLYLLSQIPPPRGGTGPRWEAGAPLDIVFYAVDQNDAERRDTATQLLALVRLFMAFSAYIEVPCSSSIFLSRGLLMVRCLLQH